MIKWLTSMWAAWMRLARSGKIWVAPVSLWVYGGYRVYRGKYGSSGFFLGVSAGYIRFFFWRFRVRG